MNSRHAVSAAMMITAVMLAACFDENPVADSGEAQPEPPLRSAVNIPDDEIFEAPEMLEIAREMPDFAGFYRNEQGEIEVALRDVSRLAEAEGLIRSRLSSHELAEARFVARAAEFSFLELARYRTALMQHIFQIRGVSSLGVGESVNRVTISLADETARPEVLGLLQTLGIPIEAVHLWNAPYARESLEITDRHPQGHIEGGWKIATSATAGCTLGFPVIRHPFGDTAFVVNSHCTASAFALDGQPVYQPSSGWPQIGYEISDPAPYSCALFGYSDCRRSDAALIRATVPIELGSIARTTQSSGCEGCSMPKTVDSSNPTIQIIDVDYSAIENEILHKIGQKTGWTYGAVEATCEDWPPDEWGFGVVKVCSDRIDYSSDEGDSGSPVFKMTATDKAILVGIHWGYIPWPYSDGAASPVSGIRWEFGELSYFDPGSPDVHIEGPDTIPPGIECHWDARGEWLPPVTYQWGGLASGNDEEVDAIAYSSGLLQILVTDFKGREGVAQLYITVEEMEENPDGCWA